VVPEVSFAKYFNQTVLGEAGIHWKQTTDELTMEVKVPIGSSATVFVPGRDLDDIRESGLPVTDSEFIRIADIKEEGYVVFEVRSGTYQFISTQSSG
jgi:alpha-L-rhamnosidase